MPTVKPDAVADVEPLDGLAEVWPANLHEQMIVISHQHIGVQTDFESLDHLGEDFQKAEAILVVAEDVAPLIPASGDMIPCAETNDPQRASHVRSMSLKRSVSIVNYYNPTPMAKCNTTVQIKIFLKREKDLRF